MALPREALAFPSEESSLLCPYLPKAFDTPSPAKPFTTLTYATSLDNSLALSPGVQTALSGPQSKAMTHYLRSKHDAILIGCGTAIADNPSLNCRIEGVGGYGGQGLDGQPRPVVVDPKGRWDVSAESKVVKLAAEGKGKAPWILTVVEIGEERRQLLENVGGKYFMIPPSVNGKLDWNDVLTLLAIEGIKSVMIEGGGVVINDLLNPRFFSIVDAVIITIAPTWLGKGGVAAQPDERRDEQGNKIAVGSLKEVRWVPLGDDVVLCGFPRV